MKKLFIVTFALFTTQYALADDYWLCSDAADHSAKCYSLACVGDWLFDHRKHDPQADCDVSGDSYDEDSITIDLIK